ncbi:YcnI family protein [Elstera cyanobacteriorum]|uniref:YncI copper-binding domain-containing protein n=1 Tax=Elstera cyanobacteriorum TaxID=2022747 RepID=A0A255XSB4_9PROT|nr:YcnI family protein [Elstera cyanobacteriorum]MCK6441788.1 YcnI family protein [Elstera cyanobacteriorum]OYQ19868.1 hypothetical protein CHR90_07045 [Elstera cyanobacteriorum]GFZ96144.1 hypothetical protein GCM10011497_28400 [Elstera cyanobacteriorum]
MKTTFAALMGAAVLAFSAAATAHATLETSQAVAGSYYKAVVRIGHGCEGKPTLKVRVKIPNGVSAVKVMPKAGWTLDIVKGPLATPLDDGHGGKITEGVTEVVWSGSLDDAHYDEFVLRGKLPDAPNTTLWWPVVQECNGAAHRWIEIPAAGQDPHSLKEPAPGLKLTPKP